MKTIEFLGVPGAGKSTIYSEMKQSLSGKHVFFGMERVIKEKLSVDDFAYKILESVSFGRFKEKIRNKYYSEIVYPVALSKFLDINPWLVREAIQSSSINGEIFENNQIALWLKPHLQLLIATRSLCDNDIFFIDEGVFQRATTFYASYKDEDVDKSLQNYIECIHKPDAIIYADAGNDVCISRLQNRTTGKTKRLDNKSVSLKSTFLESSRRIIEKSLQISGFDKANLIRVNTDKNNISQCMSQVHRALEKIL